MLTPSFGARGLYHQYRQSHLGSPLSRILSILLLQFRPSASNFPYILRFVNTSYLPLLSFHLGYLGLESFTDLLDFLMLSIVFYPFPLPPTSYFLTSLLPLLLSPIIGLPTFFHLGVFILAFWRTIIFLVVERYFARSHRHSCTYYMPGGYTPVTIH